IVMSVIFELGKYVIPHFHVPVAVTAYCTGVLTAAVFLPAVIVDLGTRTARACAVLPEVIFFSKLVNALRCDADLVSPDGERLVILQIYGRIQTIRIQSHYLCEKLPGPGNGFLLKIIAEGEVT